MTKVKKLVTVQRKNRNKLKTKFYYNHKKNQLHKDTLNSDKYNDTLHIHCDLFKLFLIKQELCPLVCHTSGIILSRTTGISNYFSQMTEFEITRVDCK